MSGLKLNFRIGDTIIVGEEMHITLVAVKGRWAHLNFVGPKEIKLSRIHRDAEGNQIKQRSREHNKEKSTC